MQTRRETALFRRFEADSSVAAHWLRNHDRARYTPKTIAIPEADAEDLENEEDEWLRQDDEGTEPGGTNRFVDRLLNIAKEARLLVECKDIQDELGILTMVLRQQKGALHEMERSFGEVPTADDDKRYDLSRKLAQQKALIDLHLLDIERMDKAAKAVNISLTQVLDLKQKHANALEVRRMTFVTFASAYFSRLASHEIKLKIQPGKVKPSWSSPLLLSFSYQCHLWRPSSPSTLLSFHATQSMVSVVSISVMCQSTCLELALASRYHSSP